MFSSISKEDRKVEAATPENGHEAIWALNLEIGDEVNQSPEVAQAYVKSIKRRLVHKSPNVQVLTLTLLEAIVKNGRSELHDMISSQDTLKLISDLGVQGKTPEVRNKALELLQDWAATFTPMGLLSFNDAYVKLRNKGIPFPDRSKSGVILTPPVNSSVARRKSSASNAPPRHELSQQADVSMYTTYSIEYIQKLKREAAQGMEYILLFREVLMGLSSVAEVKSNESVISLYSTISDIRARVSLLLVELENEELMELMISMNDIIRTILDYYTHKVKGTFHHVPDIVVPLSLQPYMASQNKSSTAPGTKTDRHRSNASTPQQLLSFDQLTIRSQPTAPPQAASVPEDPFAAIANRKTSNPSAPSAPSAQSATSVSSNSSISSFDPFA